MYYAIFGHDVPNSLPLRKQVREQHLIRIQALADAGRVLVAGPHPAIDNVDPGEAGFTGSLIIAEFASLDDAKLWVSEDPYVTSGVFSTVEVKPFKIVIP
ncbi:MAG: YciI family protein [Congregibacter sp.]|nr:YciI family protein [Congregibacter sp.]MDP5070017.1 YciI family protein [Congregibacter sp.]